MAAPAPPRSSRSDGTGTDTDDGTAILVADGLTKHFAVRRGLQAVFSRERPVVHAIDDVDLTLRRGRVTALVGESGSGKSTVARVLAGLYPRTGGEIRLGGENVRVKGGRRFRAHCRRVQMIFQDPFASLNPVHTIRHHLSRALKIHDHAGDDLDASLGALLTRVNLTPPQLYLDKFPHELSGGQRQRISIARALAAEPEVLLADEPVSMLDVSIRLGVLNLLRDLKERLNLAILYITHDIASARYFADDTLVMYAGRMVEGGDSETLTQHPAHPYTQLLIASAPDADRLQADLHDEGDTGEPPSLINPPSGCRFHPRCPKVMTRCRTDVPPAFTLDASAPHASAPHATPPPLERVREPHWAACWLHAPDSSAPTSSAPNSGGERVPA